MAVTYIIATDIGNATIEAIRYNPDGLNKEVDFAHVVKPITIAEYERAETSANSDMRDYFIVGKQAFVVGNSARRAGSDYLRLQGAQRYTRDYYGNLFAMATAQVLPRPSSDSRNQKTECKVKAVIAFPPIDRDYANDQVKAIKGKWRVTWRGVEYHFEVIDAVGIDEPLAGIYNTILNKDGSYAKRAQQIISGVTLSIDPGGFTTDAIAIDPNARVDYTSATSYAGMAAQRSLESFAKDIRSQYARILKGSRVDMGQITDALRTGTLDLRGLNKHDVSTLAQEYRNELFSVIEQIVNQYGGAAQFDTLYFTGGVSGLIRDEIKKRITHNNIIFADEAHMIHYANARGLMRFAQFVIEKGKF